jgi:O-antigen ligase
LSDTQIRPREGRSRFGLPSHLPGVRDEARGYPGRAMIFLLGFLLVLPCLGGSLSSIVAMVLGILLVPVMVVRPSPWAEVPRQPALVIFLGVFAVLAIAFALTAKQPADLRFLANFLSSPLAVAIYLRARASAGTEAAHGILLLCLAGTAVGAVTAAASVGILNLERAQGFLGGPNLMPRVAIMLGFAAPALLFFARPPLAWLGYAGPLLAMAVTLLAASRGAALALPALALVLIVFLAIRRETRLHVAVLIGLGAVAGVALVVLAPVAWERLLSALSTIHQVIDAGETSDFPTTERLGFYAVGWQAFLASPWIGHGWAHLGSAAAMVDPVTFGSQAGTMFMYHNDALNFAVAAGIVGIAAWLALLLAPILGALAVPRDGLSFARLYIATSLAVGALVFGLTDMTIGYDLTTTLYAFLTAIVLGAFRETRAA